MPPPTVVEMTADDGRLLRKLRIQERKLEKLEKKYRDVGRAGKKAGKGIKDAFGVSTLLKFTGALTGAGGLLAAFRLVNAEIKQITDRQAAAGSTQITESAANRQLIRNLPGITGEQQREVIKKAEVISTNTGVSSAVIKRAFAEGVSASGGNVSATEQAVSVAARLLSDSPSEIGRVTGSLLDIVPATGTEDALVNLGLTAAIGGRSRVTSAKQQALSIPATILGSSAFGASARTSGALFSTLSTGTGDFLGESSRTASIATFEQLRGFLPDIVGTEGKDGKDAATNRIEFLQQNPSRAREFLKNSSFEKRVKGPLEELLTIPDSSIAQKFIADRASIPDNAGLRKIGEGLLTSLDAAPGENVAKLKRGFQNTTRNINLQDENAGFAGVIREELAPFLKAIGDTNISERIAKLGFEVGSGIGTNDAFGTITGQLQDKANRLRETRKIQVFGKASGRLTDTGVTSVPTQSDLAKADNIQLLLDSLLKIQKAIEDQKDRPAGNTLGKTDQDPE